MSTIVNATNEATEVLEVQGNKLIETIKGILAAGKINRLIISSTSGKTRLDIPYGAGLTATALVTYLLPPLAISTPVLLLKGCSSKNRGRVNFARSGSRSRDRTSYDVRAA